MCPQELSPASPSRFPSAGLTGLSEAERDLTKSWADFRFGRPLTYCSAQQPTDDLVDLDFAAIAERDGEVAVGNFEDARNFVAPPIAG